MLPALIGQSEQEPEMIECDLSKLVLPTDDKQYKAAAEKAGLKILDQLKISKSSFVELMRQFWDHWSMKKVLKTLCYKQQREKALAKKLKQLREARPIGSDGRHHSIDRVAIEREIRFTPPDPPSAEDLTNMEEVMRDYSENLFDLLDINEDQSIDILEFAEICTLLHVYTELQNNDVLYKETQLQNTTQTIRKKRADLEMEEMDVDDRHKIEFQITTLQTSQISLTFDLEKARAVAENEFYTLSEKLCDQVVTAFTILQMFFLACYGTELTDELLDGVAVVFTSMHLADLVVRIISMQGLNNFLRVGCADRPQISLKRRWTFFFVCVSSVGLVLWIAAELDGTFCSLQEKRALQMMMAASILRSLVTVPSFEQTLYSVSTGVGPVSTYPTHRN